MRPSGGGRRALIFAATAFALYMAHLAWFSLFGPPDWLEGVDERAPELTRVSAGSLFERYADELAEPREAGVDGAVFPAHPEPRGRTFNRQHVPRTGIAVLQTHEGRSWTTGQHLYVHVAGDGWREVAVPDGMVLGEARVVREASGPAVVLTRWNPWWPYGRSYLRFWRGLLQPELRPERGLYAVDAAGGPLRYLGPGHTPVPSPDGGRVAFLRSERGGFHSVHLRSGDGREATTVASVWEADPGSGVSFSLDWSADSRMLEIQGRGRGFRAVPERRAGRFRLLYDVEADRLADLEAGEG